MSGHLSDDREDGLAKDNDDEQAKPLGRVFDVDAADGPVGPKAGSNYHHAHLDDDRGGPQNDGDVERQEGRDEPEDRCAAVVDPDPPRSFGRIFAVLVQPQDQQDNTNRSIGQRKGPRPFAKGTRRCGGHDARRSHGSEHRDTQRPGRQAGQEVDDGNDVDPGPPRRKEEQDERAELGPSRIAVDYARKLADERDKDEVEEQLHPVHAARITGHLCFNAAGTDDLSVIAPWYWLPRLRDMRFGIAAFVRQEYHMRGASYAQGNIGGKQRSWIRNRYSQRSIRDSATPGSRIPSLLSSNSGTAGSPPHK